jgi:hypothetical protein
MSPTSISSQVLKLGVMFGAEIGVCPTVELARVVRRVLGLALALGFDFVFALAFRLAFIVESLGPLVRPMIANV